MNLHLGCGKRYLEGFVHIDLADYPHIDYKSDIAKLPMIKDSNVELIYCCHAFEYYDRQQAVEVLKEWRRILKPNGILRLAVPDFEQWVKVYKQTGRLEDLLGALYGRWQIGNTDKIIYHKTTYDFNSLGNLLESCGFGNVRRYNYKDWFPEGYDDFSRCFIPHIKDCKSIEEYEQGLLVSLNIEARKL